MRRLLALGALAVLITAGCSGGGEDALGGFGDFGADSIAGDQDDFVLHGDHSSISMTRRVVNIAKARCIERADAAEQIGRRTGCVSHR